jgi:hypothetical protein
LFCRQKPRLAFVPIQRRAEQLFISPEQRGLPWRLPAMIKGDKQNQGGQQQQGNQPGRSGQDQQGDGAKPGQQDQMDPNRGGSSGNKNVND